MTKKPENVENPKLKQLIGELWTRSTDAIGDGSMADAIRHERKKGEATAGVYHSQKGRDYVKAVWKWLRSKTKPKPDSDKRVAREIIQDLREALTTEPEDTQ